MSTGGNEWIAWVMLCVGLCTSITTHIHMEATVTEKICISLHCIQHNHRAHHVTCYRGVLLNLDPSPWVRTICVPGEPTLTAVYSFPARPLRKDSSRASPHIWMTQRLEAGVAGIVGGGFIPVLSCACIVPVALTHCCSCAADSIVPIICSWLEFVNVGDIALWSTWWRCYC